MKYILGIDTSCYTTSLACVSLEGKLLLSKQKLLSVPDGARGLQQSSAVFSHLRNLPELSATMQDSLPDGELVAICASIKPRPYKDSYMPVFVVGESLGATLAKLAGVPFYTTTHQENHIMAGLYSNDRMQMEKHFLALHLSGGTTELLEVWAHTTGFDINLIGSTQDLHAGQLVDRIGVALGLGFPSGPNLEALAEKADKPIHIPYYVKDLTVSFSGSESHAQRLIAKNADKAGIARGVYQVLNKTICKWLENAADKGYPTSVLLVGGVSSSMILREELNVQLRKAGKNMSLYFALPQLSKDNAVGTAYLGLKAYMNDKYKAGAGLPLK